MHQLQMALMPGASCCWHKVEACDLKHVFCTSAAAQPFNYHTATLVDMHVRFKIVLQQTNRVVVT